MTLFWLGFIAGVAVCAGVVSLGAGAIELYCRATGGRL